MAQTSETLPQSAPGSPPMRSWRDFDPETLQGPARDRVEELTTYRDHLDEILAHQGEHVVIRGSTILGYYPTRGQALKAALDQAPAACLVKEVVEFEPIVPLERVL